MQTTLAPGVDWVGAIDWNIRDFHSYDTERGATYNAYLVRDEKTVLVDTVKAPFFEQHIHRIRDLVDPAKIDYVVCNHAEPDHSSGLPQLLKAVPNAKLLCSAKCRETLGREYDAADWPFQVVKTGETLPIGRRALSFLETPMVHWPDSMMTYDAADRILFSMDAFGQHIATSGRFDDENDLYLLLSEAKTYYANIVLPYSTFVRKTLEGAAKLDIGQIAPSHGVVWRGHVADILRLYGAWSAGRNRPKVVVLYDSMWDATARMAEAILEGASVAGVETMLLHLRRTNLTRVATEILDAAAIAVGSPVLNQTMMPSVAAALAYVQGLRPANKAGMAFGSYGWSAKGGADGVQACLEAMKWEILHPPIRACYRPDAAILDECRRAGALLAEHSRSAVS